MKKQLHLLFLLVPFFINAQNVGIGTAAPTSKLQIHHRSSIAPGLKLVDSATNMAGAIQFQNINFSRGMMLSGFSASNFNNGQYVDIRSDSTIGATFKGNGFTGIQNLDPSFPLDVNGTTNINGTLQLKGLNLFEFGNGVAGKEPNAGKVGYNAFGQNALTFVGGGTSVANRAFYFYGEGGTTFTGPVSVGGALRINGNAGIAGQVLTSNGTAAPAWENAAYSNNIRFSFNVTQMSGALGESLDSLNFNGTPANYNLNPAMVSVVPGNNARIVINKSGLYHFSGSIGMYNTNIIPSISIGPTATLSYWVNNKNFAIESAATNSLVGYVPDDDFVKIFQFSFDVYISAGQTIKFTRSLFVDVGGFHSTTGHVNGYLISE
jgi:cytoskeletal protein CcmA (bactofilin family)